VDSVKDKIFVIRGQRGMLDHDLAICTAYQQSASINNSDAIAVASQRISLSD